MPQVACMGAMLQCSFGAAPSTLSPIPKGMPVRTGGQMAATITDNLPMANIPPFGVCMSLANPQVAAATSAALGVLTPQPCIPLITAPWTPGSPTVQINGSSALTNTSQCMCAWAGVITISSPGEMTVQAS